MGERIRRAASETAASAEPLVDARAVARHLGVSRDYVYRHADELGVRRLGSGNRPLLRFSLADVDASLRTPPALPQPRSRRRRRPAQQLLPIRRSRP